MAGGLTVVAVVLAGCATPRLGPEVDQQESTTSQDGAGARPPAGATPPGGTPPDDERGGDDPHGQDGDVPACDDRTFRAIDGVIGEQLAAFARGDYDRALELASEAFRAGVAAEDLADIIEEGYPVAADAAAHETGVCVQPSPTSAEALVEVTAGDGTRGELVYRLVAEQERWRIAGAIQVGAGSSADEATPVVQR